VALKRDLALVDVAAVDVAQGAGAAKAGTVEREQLGHGDAAVELQGGAGVDDGAAGGRRCAEQEVGDGRAPVVGDGTGGEFIDGPKAAIRRIDVDAAEIARALTAGE